MLDQLLAAPGLTPRRFALFAAVSLASTVTVVAAGAQRRTAPWDLVAAAGQRAAPVVEVTPRPAPVAQPAVAPSASPDAAAHTTGSDPAVTDSSLPAPAPVYAPVAPTPVKQPKPKAAKPAPVPAKPISKIKHVFVVDIAGSDDGPYLNETLRPQGRWLEAYKPLDQGELATEVALVSGQKATPGIQQGCPTYGGDCLFPIETLTLADQFVSGGKRWRGYFEGMPGNCTHPDLNAVDASSGDYVTRRNPFVYFHSLTELGECATNDVPLDSLTADLASAESTPNFAYVGPKDCDATCTDAFLANWVPAILASPAYQADGLLIVLTDSGALLVSQFATPASASQTAYDPFGVLRSIEDLFGLDNLGAAADKEAVSFARTEVSAGLP